MPFVCLYDIMMIHAAISIYRTHPASFLNLQVIAPKDAVIDSDILSSSEVRPPHPIYIIFQ